jgi:2-dehydropantoate 2-reductase
MDVTENIRDIAGSDLVLLTVKSQDTDSAMKAAAPHLGSAVVTSIQNGINHYRLLKHVPANRLVLGTTVTNMATVEPGVVVLQIDGLTAIGPCPHRQGDKRTSHEPRSHVELVAEVLRRTGLQVEVNQRIVGLQYNKLVINCLGCASALSDLHFVREGIFHTPWRRSVARPIYDECLAVYRTAGIEVEPLAASSDTERFGRLLLSLERPLTGRAIRWGERIFVRRPRTNFSVRGDLDRHRPTEVDFINGAVVQLAQQAGIAAPYNALVVELVHELERRPSDRILSRDEVIRRFQALPR